MRLAPVYGMEMGASGDFDSGDLFEFSGRNDSSNLRRIPTISAPSSVRSVGDAQSDVQSIRLEILWGGASAVEAEYSS